MSSSSSRISIKRQLNPKINNLKITPFYTNNTTANSSKKNTLIMNSHQQNFYKNEKIQYSSRNINLKRDKYSSILENKTKEKNKTNVSLKHMIKNKFIEAKEYSYNNKHNKLFLKNKNNDKTIYYNNNKSSRTKVDSKKDNKKNKNSIIILNKISGDNKKNLKTFRLPVSNLFNEKGNKNKNKITRKALSKNNPKNNNISRIKNDKSKDKHDKNSFNIVSKKIISRNQNLKVQSSSHKNINTKCTSNSVRLYNTNNSYKNINKHYYNNNYTNCTTKVSCSNSLSKSKNNTTVYYKKKMDDTFQKKIDKIENQKLIKIREGNYLSNHNYLVNLILENKKFGESDKFGIYKKLKENNSIKNINKKSESKSVKKIDEKHDNSSMKDSQNSIRKQSNKIEKNHKTKKIIINRNDNKLLKKFKSVEDITINNKNKTRKTENNNNDIQKKNNIRRVIKYNEQNSNSIINLGKKESFIDMVDTYTKFSKEKNDKETKINNIKINEFNVQKPKEENMKFTLLKNRYEDEESKEETIKSKIIIGTIEGYKDIIESDKLNNCFFQRDNSINVLESNASNTLDNDSLSRKINKKILKSFNIIDENESNNIEGLERYSNNINGFLLNESEIKSILNYVEDENDIGDLSTTILKINKKYINSVLLPYHVNKISFMKKYNNQTKKYLIKENFNNDNILLIDNNKISNKKKENICKENNYNKIKENKRDEIIKYITRFKFNAKNKTNNVIQNSCNLFIEGNDKDKKCIIF